MASSKIYNIGNPRNNFSVKELAEMMLELAKAYPEYRKTAAKTKLVKVSASQYYGKGYQDVQNRVPGITNTMADLDWKPRVTMKDALKRIFDAYRGDVAEARAISLALGERAATVPVSGTKALYGHPLGASGAIEAAICALTIRDGWAPPSVNLVEADSEIAALLPGLLREGRDGLYRRILSTSFGFGGLNASLVFGAVEG
jgi:hypothetical protein